jgi:uncharacterized protein YhfF
VTSLPGVDHADTAAFWRRGVEAGALPEIEPVPPASAFGDSVELADELIAIVVHGPKRATCGAVAEDEADGESIPTVGTWTVATDGSGRPRAALRTTDVRIGPLSSVDDAFAWDEGEGDRSRATWLADHTDYLSRRLPALGAAFHPDVECVFQRFEVAYAE